MTETLEDRKCPSELDSHRTVRVAKERIPEDFSRLRCQKYLVKGGKASYGVTGSFDYVKKGGRGVGLVETLPVPYSESTYKDTQWWTIPDSHTQGGVEGTTSGLWVTLP